MASTNLILAMARGGWNRVRSSVLGGNRSPSRIIQIVDSPPTSVLLSQTEARTAMGWVKDAFRAVTDWWNGGDEKSIAIPVIPNPELPALDGGEPGKFNLTVVIKDPEKKMPPTPVGVSVNKLPTVRELVEMIDEYIAENAGTGSPRYNQFLKDLGNKLLYDPRNAIAPLDLLERLQR